MTERWESRSICSRSGRRIGVVNQYGRNESKTIER